jgi:hypothetical protein
MSPRAATICSRRFGNTDLCEALAKESAAFAVVIRGDPAGMTRRDFGGSFAGGRNAGQGPLWQPPLTIVACDTIFPALIWRRLRLAIGFAARQVPGIGFPSDTSQSRLGVIDFWIAVCMDASG